MSKPIYIDCEFDGHGGPLLSIALVRSREDSLYVMVIDTEAKDPWVRENVLPVLHKHEAPDPMTARLLEVGALMRDFIGPSSPVIIADSPVDIGRFCEALSTGPDGGWVPSGYRKMSFEVHNVDCYPTELPGAVQHNAWWDALALREKVLWHD